MRKIINLASQEVTTIWRMNEEELKEWKVQNARMYQYGQTNKTEFLLVLERNKEAKWRARTAGKLNSTTTGDDVFQIIGCEDIEETHSVCRNFHGKL